MKLSSTLAALPLCVSVLGAIGAVGFVGNVQAAATPVDYAKTKYPIVLVHGLSGSEKLYGLVDYWWQMASDLRHNGATVYVVTINAYNTDYVRGENLLKQVQMVLAATGATKVNLIGHSQGGITARYVAAIKPELVASVTSISTPHRGTEYADSVNEMSDDIKKKDAIKSSFLGKLNAVLNGQTNLAQDPLAALAQLTTQGSAKFNRAFSSAGLGATCTSDGADSETRGASVQKLYSWTGNAVATNALDFTQSTYAAQSATIIRRGGGVNDGVVPVCSARFGRTLGVYGWNHTDAVNQFIGLRSSSSADPVATLRTHANRLKLAGL
jgi:triacylglycerol lipase